MSSGPLTPEIVRAGSLETSNTYVVSEYSPPAKILSPLWYRYCMWCGSFSTSGPTVAVLTTLP